MEILERLPNKPMVTLPPWPGLAKVQRKKTCFVQVYFALSKSQSYTGSRDVVAPTVSVLLRARAQITMEATSFTSISNFHFLPSHCKEKFQQILERSSSTGGVARLCFGSGEYSMEGAEDPKLDKGPLRRSSSLLVGVAMENINKEEVVEWMKLWAMVKSWPMGLLKSCS